MNRSVSPEFLNSFSSQCTRGKSSIVQNQKSVPKFLSDKKLLNQRPMGHNAHLNVQLWWLYSAKILQMLHARKINLLFAMATNQIQQFGLNSYGVRGLLKEYYRFWMFFFSLENLAFRLPWPPIKISDLDKIHMVGRGLFQKHFSKTFDKISAVTRK